MLSLSRHARIACLPLVLGACSGGAEVGGNDKHSGEKARPKAPPIEYAPCALHGAEDFITNCTVERDGRTIVIRHPDGGFRRFIVDGGNVSTADGAHPVKVEDIPGHPGFELTVEQDHYQLLPAAPTDAP